MKRLIKILVPFALFAACTQQKPLDRDKDCDFTGDDVVVCDMDASVFAAETDSDADPESKTSLSSSHVPVWYADDQIRIFGQNGTGNRFKLTAGAGTARATFRGALPESNTFYAIYPYTDGCSYSSGALHFSTMHDQACTEGDFANGGNVMVASFTSSSLAPSFKNVFGLLEFRFSGTADVGRVVLTSRKSSDVLWGDFTLAMDGRQGTDNQTISAVSGSNEVSISFETPVRLSEGAYKQFFFILPAGTLSTGFTLDIFDGAGNQIYTKTTTKAQTILRSKIKIMPEITDVNRDPASEIYPEPFTWAAYNSLKRSASDATVIDPQTSGYPRKSERPDKYVGMFYFIWHSSFSAAGRVPHDNQARLGEGNYEYQTGWAPTTWCSPCGYPHHWGRSYLDYYRDDDSWVLRKHAQMLSDAGVDFICFDVTNNSFYISEVLNLCRVWSEVRAEGGDTPQITFMIWHSRGSSSESDYNKFDHEGAVTTLYNNIYSHSEYSDLWFRWEGKPLMLAMGEHVKNATIRNYFTFRRSWYIWNNNWQTDVDANDPWWNGNSEDKWPWGCCYTDDVVNTMKAGTHQGVNECAPVSPATHPVSNIGRSFQVGSGCQAYKNHQGSIYQKAPEKGIYFKQQFAAAKNLDPKVLFFTGWNEYLVGHSQAPTSLQFPYMCGQTADYIFVDQYNNEFSRDIEPISGDFGDSYYYYMVDFIRQFKGVDETRSFNKNHSITIDGNFVDWMQVGSCYADDKSDNKWRGYDSNGGNGARGFNLNDVYVNQTGRNDLYISKVATDGTKLYFYINAESALEGYSQGNTGLNLLIGTGASNKWEGFSYLLSPTSATKATLSRCNGGWSWTSVSTDINIAVSGNAMEVAIPLSSLGISTPNAISIDFKWVDNVDLSASDGIQRCMRDGDSAPNGRFRYRYVFKK